jgi:hypothetical protein
VQHSKIVRSTSVTGHFPALPHRSIAVRSTLSERTFGLVGFMTIWPASPSRPFFTPAILLGKIIFRPSPLTIFVRVAKFPPHQDEASAPHQPAHPWQGGFPKSGMWS